MTKKTWRIMKRMPSTTTAIHWHLKINDKDYIAAIADCRRAGWWSSVFSGTKSGHVSNWSPIVNVPGKYVYLSISQLFERLKVEFKAEELKAEIEKSNEKFFTKQKTKSEK